MRRAHCPLLSIDIQPHVFSSVIFLSLEAPKLHFQISLTAECQLHPATEGPHRSGEVRRKEVEVTDSTGGFSTLLTDSPVSVCLSRKGVVLTPRFLQHRGGWGDGSTNVGSLRSRNKFPSLAKELK